MENQTTPEPASTNETTAPFASLPFPGESLNRNGKIARLPRDIREVLNIRLSDGESGRELVAWLNTLPGVHVILNRYFNNVPISESNMTHWKQGGYRDWLRHHESRERALSLGERAREIAADLRGDEKDGAGLATTSESLAVLLSLELARDVETTLAETTDRKERWKVLKEMLQLVGRVRQDDQRAAKLKLAQERMERELPDKNRGKTGNQELDDLADDIKIHAARTRMWGAALAGTLEEQRASTAASRASEANPFGQ